MTSNNPVDQKTIDSIRRQIGQQAALHVRWNNNSSQSSSDPPPEETTIGFLFGNLFKSRIFYS